MLPDDGVRSGYVWSVPLQQSMDQPGKKSCSSTAEQGKMTFSLSPFAPENMV